jgi:hypothetical protein
MTLQMVVFLFAFCSAVYFARESWRAAHSLEFKLDLERLREKRRLCRPVGRQN